MDYIVATSGRTGSNVLQRLMRNNGFCDPNEWFHPEFGFGEAVENGTSTEQWLAATREKRARHDTFGVKLMAHTMDLMGQHMRPPESNRGAALTRLLPDASYVYLFREDTYRQAISNWRAEISGRWIQLRNQEQHDFEYVPIDLARIQSILGYVDRCNRFWVSFFEREEIAPYVISYERLIESPRQALLEIADFLGMPIAGEPELDLDIVQQADELTDRYVAELEALLGKERPGVWIPASASVR